MSCFLCFRNAASSAGFVNLWTNGFDTLILCESCRRHTERRSRAASIPDGSEIPAPAVREAQLGASALDDNRAVVTSYGASN